MDDLVFFMDDSYIDAQCNKDLQYANEAGVASLLTKDTRELEKNTNISEEILLDNGFEKKYSNILKEYRYDKYVMTNDGRNAEYHIEISQWSNTPNRDWSMHIDNEVCSTCCCIDIGSVWHFNKTMKLMDIDFRINL